VTQSGQTKHTWRRLWSMEINSMWYTSLALHQWQQFSVGVHPASSWKIWQEGTRGVHRTGSAIRWQWSANCALLILHTAVIKRLQTASNVAGRCKFTVTRKLAVVEYSSTFPVDRAEHGNSAVAGQECVCSKRKVIDDIDDQLLHTAKWPRDIYQSMTAANPDGGPRNMCQVHSQKAHVQQQQQPHHRANLADEVQIVMCRLNEHKFVISVYATADKPPCVVL